MANNRLILYCSKCLGYVYLAKYYPVAWYSHGISEEVFKEFFEKHQQCVENAKKELQEYEGDIWRVTSEVRWNGYIDVPCRQLQRVKPEWWNNNDHEHNKLH